MRTPLGHRGFRDLFIGQIVSALGDWMGTVALIVLVLDLTGSSTAVGGVLVLQLLPSAVGGPIASRVVGRWRRRRAMMGADLFRAAIAVVLPLVETLWWVYLWAFFLQLGGLVFLPARDASIPDLVEGDEDELSLANGIILGSSFGTIPLGAAAFGGVTALQTMLFGHGGLIGSRPYLLVFLIDGLTFLVSFVFVRSLHVLDERGEMPQEGEGPEAQTRFTEAFRIPLVRMVVPAAATITLGIGTLFSVGVKFVRQVLDATDTQFGIMIAIFGAGAAAGLGILQALRHRDQLMMVRIAVALQGAVVAIMSLSPNITIAFIGAGAFGAASAASLVAGMNLLQTRLEGRDRVQAFTAFHVTIRAGLALAALAAGVAVDLIDGVRWPLVGLLPPARVVLLSAGILVFLSAAWVHEPDAAQKPAPYREEGLP